ncbi:hypothetical protein K0651_13265 [Ornithinimicrobium sp. Arc0846-15]|nr:hypothetical protein [Ornithinimicrobium laminariae]
MKELIDVAEVLTVSVGTVKTALMVLALLVMCAVIRQVEHYLDHCRQREFIQDFVALRGAQRRDLIRLLSGGMKD